MHDVTRGLAALGLVLAGCASMGRGSRHEMGPPATDRCAGTMGGRAKACAQDRDAAYQQVRKLYVDDQICIDGLQPLSSTSTECTVRAFVEGVSGQSYELEIRAAPDGNKYKLMEEWWFDEAAIVDLQLQALGYGTPATPSGG